MVAVSEVMDSEPVRTFSTFTGHLHRLVEWLKELGIATAAMESTGVYWIPAFEILQARGVRPQSRRLASPWHTFCSRGSALLMLSEAASETIARWLAAVESQSIESEDCSPICLA